MVNMSTYVSQYLNIYPSHRNTIILFHGITGCVDEINDPNIGKLLKSCQRNKTPLDFNIDEKNKNFLTERGHLTTKNPIEEHKFFCDYVEKIHNKTVEKKNEQGFLMLVLSYYCNLACPYCFQNSLRHADLPQEKQKMTIDQVDLIFNKTLKNLFPLCKDFEKTHIKLYGGEPFLERNREALERIFYYTQKHSMRVSAISNSTNVGGFLDFFGKEKGLVEEVQISFDGDKIHHDRSRITHYGKGTFEEIVQNIHKLIKRETKLSLRINTHSKNVDSLDVLWNSLKAEGILDHENVSTYAATVEDHQGDQVDSEDLLTRMKLSKIMKTQAHSITSPQAQVYTLLKKVFKAEKGITLNRTNYCMQNTPQSFLIDHLQDIYGCYEEAGKRHLRAGYFDDQGKVFLNNRYQVYQSRHVGNYEPCSKCSVALTCGGGCPVAARGTGSSPYGIFQSHCSSQRELVAKSVQELFEEFAEKDQLMKPMPADVTPAQAFAV